MSFLITIALPGLLLLAIKYEYPQLISSVWELVFSRTALMTVVVLISVKFTYAKMLQLKWKRVASRRR